MAYDINNVFYPYLDILDQTYAGSRLIAARIRGTQIYLKDSLNHFKISVEEMGKQIGLEKLKVDGNFDNVEYCRRDAEITYKFMHSMQTYYESFGCKMKTTIGATALNFFNDHFYKYKSPLEAEEIDFCIKGYYGGRTEIFFNKRIEGDIQIYDYNSLYPSVLEQNRFPMLKRRHYTSNPDFSLEGMVHAKVFAPKMHIPYLPLKTKKKLIFPTGTFEGQWTYFEIREAEKLGYKVLKINKALEFKNTFNPFKDLVNGLYRKRVQAQNSGNELLSEALKNILNNLSGKFNQGRGYLRILPFKMETYNSATDKIMGNVILRKVMGNYPRHTNGIWGSYITAYGRHEVNKALYTVLERGGTPIYCDTDAVVFKSDRQIFTDSNELGKLKNEGAKIEQKCGGKIVAAHYKLPKVYCLELSNNKKLYKAKGIPRAQAEDFFVKKKASFRKPVKLKELLRQNLKQAKFLAPNDWVLNEKEFRQKYDKRRVLKNGSTVAHDLK